MGRGRAKAKQTKVARDLKYRPVDTDLRSLERELRGENYSEDTDDSSVPDPYADLAEQYNQGYSDDHEGEYERR